jgi:hypothetical protein
MKAEECSLHHLATWLVKGENFHIIDLLRAKLGYPELRRMVIAQARQYVAN